MLFYFRRNVMKDLVKVIQEESYTYRDPITSFIEDLYVNFDFKGAQQKLRECETVLFNDFFLVACLDDFIENSRLMIFETFCRIHQCISISMLAEKLNMGTGKKMFNRASLTLRFIYSQIYTLKSFSFITYL